MTMDATSQATVDRFFAEAPLGQVDVTVAGVAGTQRLAANLPAVQEHVSWNMPAEQGIRMEALSMDNMFHSDGIDLKGLQGNEPGPQVAGPNRFAAKPNKPGLG